MARPIYEIALEIRSLWKNPYFGAVPYLDAMVHLESIDDYFFVDSAKEVILYFLANASTFRGEDAKRLKKELKDLVK